MFRTAPRAQVFPVGTAVVPVYDADLEPGERSGPGTVVRAHGHGRWVRHADGTVVPWLVIELQAPAAAVGLPAAA